MRDSQTGGVPAGENPPDSMTDRMWGREAAAQRGGEEGEGVGQALERRRTPLALETGAAQIGVNRDIATEQNSVQPDLLP